MKKRSKKTRRKDKKVVSLQDATAPTGTYVCGFRINKEKHNQLWRWDTLEDVAV